MPSTTDSTRQDLLREYGSDEHRGSDVAEAPELEALGPPDQAERLGDVRLACRRGLPGWGSRGKDGFEDLDAVEQPRRAAVQAFELAVPRTPTTAGAAGSLMRVTPHPS
ncbi:hypothetical protein [Brachybacterium sp. sponge]|uniref:hypothetical protein n=1 Tax=Brachybacterium sp. sponge TaxID=1775432 RepID=UPI0012E7817D|nr:hypothetical protein [Brachybacterium sp. sponge]